jgi:hypothetical protein
LVGASCSDAAIAAARRFDHGRMTITGQPFSEDYRDKAH